MDDLDDLDDMDDLDDLDDMDDLDEALDRPRFRVALARLNMVYPTARN